MSRARGGKTPRMATPGPERDRRLLANGAKLLALGAAMAVVGLVLVLLLSGYGNGIGVAIASLGCVPLFAGLGMILSAIVSRRARAGKPFA